LQHTSAGLTLNESLSATHKPLLTVRNWDADVRKDMIDALDKLAPEQAKYRHNSEGSDDMVPRLPTTKVYLGTDLCSLHI